MKLNSLDDIYLVSDRIVPVAQTEINIAESEPGSAFPPGYREFMLKFGVGDFSGYVRPYPPDRIVQQLKQNRESLAHGFWEAGRIKPTESERLGLIPFADTIDSDLFAFHPRDVSEMYMFPRQHNEIVKIGSSFLELLDWVATSEIIVQAFPARFFQPWNNYASLRLDNPSQIYKPEDIQTIFESIGPAAYCVMADNEIGIDFFIRKWGAHLSYYCFDGHAQLIMHFDYGCAPAFVALIENAFSGKGFKVTEHYRVDVLPILD